MVTLAAVLALSLSQGPAIVGEPCQFRWFGDNAPQISKSKEAAMKLARLEFIKGESLPEVLNTDAFKDPIYKAVDDFRAKKTLIEIDSSTRGHCLQMEGVPIAENWKESLPIYQVKITTGQFKGQTVWSPDVEKWEKPEPPPTPSHWWPVARWEGEGIKRTEPFEITSGVWAIGWAIDPQENGFGNFLSINVEMPANDWFGDLAANVANVGYASDLHYVYRKGTFNLKISSAGQYRIGVIEWRKQMHVDGVPYNPPKPKPKPKKKPAKKAVRKKK